MTLEPGRIPGEEPLAYFLTWTAYGSWLPGDERGWVAKPGQARPADERLRKASRQLMAEPALCLDAQQRRIVEETIADHCRIRGWHLHVVNARTEHVHVVVTAPGREPDDVLEQFKAWCTRRLKQQGPTDHSATARQKWWTQGGSKRWLNDARSLEEAIRYVAEGQGATTPRLADDAQA